MELRFRSLLLLALAANWFTPAWAVDVPVAETQVHEFTSAHTGRRYQLRIGLPRNYDPVHHRYTVVYQLDGQWDFDRVFPLTRAMEADHRMEPVIVAAITYGGDNPDYGGLRQRDYTPTDFLGGGQSGDAPKFLQTLRQEIIPLVESNYACRTDERVLMGSSYGGLFTCFALVRAPELFTGYVASSPSVWVDDLVMAREAAAAGPRLAGRALKVRIITGANETGTQRSSAQAFYNALVALNLPGLDLTLTFAPSERHGAVAQVAYDDGLPEVLAAKAVLFPPGPGEPVGWRGTEPPVTYFADRVNSYDGPLAGATRRGLVLEPTAGIAAASVRGVVYVLDGQWDLRSVDGSYGGMLYDGEVSPLLRVGVDWTGNWSQIAAWRDRDFTPTDPAGAGQYGGAAVFRALLQEKVLPDAEKNLTSAPGYRLVVASEKGALWALTDLLSAKPTFDRYLLVAPAAEWDHETLLQLEATRAARGGSLAARVIIYYGDRDATSSRGAAIERFVSQLLGRNYAGLSVQLIKLSGRGFAEAKRYGYHKGFRLLAP
ncbi:MAG TPA: alpha/beta hydrolase-fold protein [Lacunisphaera sp.]|nr:alpha/beta hydrolase-fold protein [Lacunisphaera sp.]